MWREIAAHQVLFRSFPHGAVMADGGDLRTTAAVRSPFESLRTNGQPRCNLEVVGSDFPQGERGVYCHSERSGAQRREESKGVVDHRSGGPCGAVP